jgi:hypothetical protein
VRIRILSRQLRGDGFTPGRDGGCLLGEEFRGRGLRDAREGPREDRESDECGTAPTT